MDALWGSVPERAVTAIEAGCDIALNCWADMEDMIGIAKMLPTISQAAAVRLERALAATNPAAADMSVQAALLAKRDTLLGIVEA
jgi:beta-N-acetylhexosaminidase